MTEFFLQYGLFLAKTLTLVIAFIVIASTIFSLALKNRTEDGVLVVASVNDKMDDLKVSLQAETLPKKEFKQWLKKQKAQDKKAEKTKHTFPRLFILRFDGDMKASEVAELRETITAVLEIALPKDEVLVVLESAGGFVHSYGLAAYQLNRVREKKIPLTVAIDKIAASGGYMMAAVANKIIAAPFSIVGSIGVVAQLPNFHRLLQENHIDFELHTAGEFKRTLTLFGENTTKAREKFQEELEETHSLFKGHLAHFRPQLDITQVATGEHWHGSQALQLNLIDAIQTSDEFILEKVNAYQVFEVGYEIKQKLMDKLTSGVFGAIQKNAMKTLSKMHAKNMVS